MGLGVIGSELEGQLLFFGRLERSKTAATHIFWEQGNVALDVYAFASPAERSCPFAALNIRIYFVSPPPPVEDNHVTCEQMRARRQRGILLRLCTRTAAVMPLSRLLF